MNFIYLSTAFLIALTAAVSGAPTPQAGSYPPRQDSDASADHVGPAAQHFDPNGHPNYGYPNTYHPHPPYTNAHIYWHPDPNTYPPHLQYANAHPSGHPNPNTYNPHLQNAAHTYWYPNPNTYHPPLQYANAHPSGHPNPNTYHPPLQYANAHPSGHPNPNTYNPHLQNAAHTYWYPNPNTYNPHLQNTAHTYWHPNPNPGHIPAFQQSSFPDGQPKRFCKCSYNVKSLTSGESRQGWIIRDVGTVGPESRCFESCDDPPVGHKFWAEWNGHNHGFEITLDRLLVSSLNNKEHMHGV
ncbi:hypothetical protein L208DRAFT_732089 [Tricholoma matsutake]|nr:hypothetical protein L208DRAFT_732089 [Tricholoma matsutake 945]